MTTAIDTGFALSTVSLVVFTVGVFDWFLRR